MRLIPAILGLAGAIALLGNVDRAMGQGDARVRVAHASPDAPSVDVLVKDGPVLFSNVEFRGVGDYAPVGAGT